MTDRYSAFWVILDRDIRDDDAEAIINAIKQLRGIVAVTPHLSNPDAGIATLRLKNGLIQKLIKVVEEHGE
jgi:hypothetical protein